MDKEQKKLFRIAQLLEVTHCINPEKMNVYWTDLRRAITENCRLDNSAIKKAIQNDTELYLNDADKNSLIEDLIAVRRRQRMEIPRIMGGTTASNNEEVAASTTASNNGGVTGSAIASNDYQTLMLYGQIISFLGWFMVIGCGLVILYGVFTGEGSVSIAAALLIPLSFLIVAAGQIYSCFVSIERNGKETTRLLQKILDKMEAAD